MKTLIISLLLLATHYANAAAKTWVGTTTVWETSTNWSPSGVPGSADDVTIPTSPTGGNFPTYTATTGSLTIKSLTLSSGAQMTITGGTLTVSGGASTIGTSATLTISGGTIDMSTQNLTLTGTITQSNGTYKVKDFSGAGTYNQSGGTFQETHDYKLSGLFSGTGGTVQFTASSSASATFAAGTNQFFNVLINSAVNPGFENVAGSDISIAADFTNNNTGLNITANCTFTFNGSGSQSLTNSITAFLDNIVVNKTSGTLTLSSSYLYLYGSLTVTQGTFSLANNALELSSTVTMNGGTLDLGSGSLKYYSTMTIAGGAITGTSAYMYAGADITISSGSINVPSGTMDLWFSLTNNSSTGAFTYGTVNLNGAAKTIGGTAGTVFTDVVVGAGTAASYTLNTSGTCSSLTLFAGVAANTLSQASGISLTVNGAVTINQPTANTLTNAWNINAGSATVSGLITFAGSNATATRIGKIVITTGTLNANGGLTFTASASATKVIDMSTGGGTGTLNLKGTLTAPASSSTLTAGTSGSTINYVDNAAQTLNFFPAGAYNNLAINNTHASGTTLSAAITTSNVTGTISVGNVNSGSLFATGNFAVGINNSKSLTVASGSSLDAGTSVVTYGTSGTATINGTFKTANTVGFSGSATTAINSTNSPTITLGGSSTIEYNSGSTQTVTQRTDYANLVLTGASKTIASGTITVSKNFTINTGATYLGSTNNPTLNIGGDFSNSGTFTQGTALVSFNGTVAQAIGGSSTTTFSNALTISNTSAAITANTSFNANGTFTINASAILTPAAAVIVGGTGTLTGNGKAQVTRTAATADFSTQYSISNKTITNLTIDYIGAGDQSVNALAYGNLTISQNGTRTVTLANSGSIGVTGTFSPTSSTTTYVITSSTVDFNGSGSQTVPAFNYNNLTVTLNGTRTVTLASSGTVGIAATFSPAAGTTSYTLTGSTVDFNGSSAQNIPAFTFNNLKSSNSSGTTLTGNVNTGGTLTLNSGKITIPTGYTLNITSGNAVSGSGFGASKHIVTQVNTGTGAKGYLRIGNFSSLMVFPVGNGSYYLPATLSPSATFDFSVCVFQGATKNGEPNGTAFGTTSKNTIIDAIWHVNKNSGTGSANLQLDWPAGVEGSTFSSYADDELGISHFDGTDWDLAMGTGSQAGNTTTRSAISSFSPFGVGKVGIPLPLKFGNVKAYQKNNGVQVDWTSLSEFNVDHYEIERSSDGINFSTAGQKTATGNTASPVNYGWLDLTAVSGTIYYRIKAVDIDGKYYYSPVVRISFEDIVGSVGLFPNLVVSGYMTIQLSDLQKGNYTVKVFNNNGQLVHTQPLLHNGGILSEVIQLPGISSGMYHLQLENAGGKIFNRSFIVQ